MKWYFNRFFYKKICRNKFYLELYHIFFFSPRHLLSPGPDQQRTLSELELFRQKHNLPEDGEFYTAIGPDGKKQIIMKLPGRV